MPPFGKIAQLAGLLGWLMICFIAATVGAVASREADRLYVELIRPDWSPPAWVFGPVWTLLYFLMAVSAWLIWQSRESRRARVALVFFVIQLVLNTLWSWLFFRWYQGFLSFLDILLLWMLIVVTLVLFWRIRPPAGVLLVPYLLWVSFAVVLNYSIWQLNRSVLS